MSHVCVQKFDVTKNLKKNLELNKALVSKIFNIPRQINFFDTCKALNIDKNKN